MSKFKFEVGQQIGRSILYALTSGFALLSGIFLQPNDFDLGKLKLGLFLFFLSMPFFIVYSIVYDYYKRGNKDDVILLGSVITILFGGIVFFAFQKELIQYIPTFSSYLIIFSIGAIYISNQKNNRDEYIRNQLIFPSLLSIGISLYYGFNLSNLSNDLYSYLPIIIFSLFFLIAFISNLNKKKFIIVSALSLLILFSFVYFINFDLPKEIIEYFSTFQFSIFIALYLSIYEAWRITAYQAKKEKQIVDNIDLVKYENEKSINLIPYAFKYSQSILIGCVITIVIVPFTFIYTNYGYLFLIGFLIQAIFTIIYWTIKSKYSIDLLKSTWVFRKGFAGFLFLTILVLGSKFDQIDSVAILDNIVDISLFNFFILLLAVVPFRNLIKSYNEDKLDGFWDSLQNMFRLRINFFRSLIIFTSIMMGFLYLIYISEPSAGVKLRIEYSFASYSLLIVLFAIIEFINYLSHNHPKIKKGLLKMSKLIPMFIGILKSSRIITSILISLLVLVPMLAFKNDFIISMIKSFPFFLAGIIGFSLNDYFDYERDLKNKPYRPLPSNQVTRKLLFIYSICVVIFSIFYSYLISASLTELIYYYLTIFGVILYNGIVKYFSQVKNLYSALISALPIFYFIWFLDLNNYYYLFPISSIFFIVGRELLMDILDIEGDKVTGLKTIPIVFNENKAKILAFTLQSFSMLILLPILFSEYTILKLSLFILITFLIILLMTLWNKNLSKSYRIRLIKIQWLHIFLGICFIVS